MPGSQGAAAPLQSDTVASAVPAAGDTAGLRGTIRIRHCQNIRVIVPYGLLFLFLIALLWPLLLGRSLYWGDLLLYFEPMLQFARGTLQGGRIPLWNPAILCGQPFLGNPQMSVFYPTTLLLPFVPVWLFVSLNTGLHLFLCGAFAYRFLQRWTLGRAAALSGALVYMGSACLVGRIQFPPMIQTAVYFPLLLLCLDACIDSPGVRAWLALALTAALTILAGHAQFAYLIFACGLMYAISRLWRRRRQNEEMPGRPWPHLGIRLAPLLGAFLVGLFAAGAQALPTLQLFRDSAREQMTASQANRFVLEPAHLLTLIMPRFFGHPGSADYWGGGNAWEPALFVGWLPLLLIGYAIGRCGREKQVRFWAIIAFVGIWLAFGKAGGLYWLAYLLVPGISNFHDPARFLFLTTFASAVLTAVGLDAIRLRWRRTNVALFALPCIALPLWYYGQDWNPTTEPAALKRDSTVLRKELKPLRNGRVYSPRRELVWDRYVNYGDFGPSDSRTMAAFLATLVPNTGMQIGIFEASGYEPVPIEASTQLDGLTRKALRRGEPNASHLLSLLQARTLLLPTGASVIDPRLPRVVSGGRVYQSNPGALPPAWLVRRMRRVDGTRRLLTALADPDFQPKKTVLLTGNAPPGYPMEWGPGPASSSTVSLRTPVVVETQRLTSTGMVVKAGDSPAFLVYASAAYPGWKAAIDGVQTRLYRADGALLGVYVPPGRHRVRLWYGPDVYRAGLYLSLLTSAALIAIGMVFKPKVRRRI